MPAAAAMTPADARGGVGANAVKTPLAVAIRLATTSVAIARRKVIAAMARRASSTGDVRAAHRR
ncbi:hypothetical protein [Nonomuraea jiangxiensis]|uniref:Uncharacterized protein n=1 Tax=Nonomuraea jiangxiensis TaxID=633440 RepID=A0A1G9HI73_9ACTN|nr:hypothetical protein [Nonomuraea jiangxiensis]SDL12701.1 hypothetical protein SAMN05421869_122119 [Nonomuraea jiangxiensis]